MNGTLELYLGVDGGQSSTTALIGNARGEILGRGTDGPCNHVKSAAEGREKFVRVIGGCVAQACQQAGVDAATVRFDAACLGFSGGPADKEAILREILAADKMRVTTDAMIALTGAAAGGPGIIVIGGTGSIAFGRDAVGRVARAGGWGYIFGDEGGAFDIARQALRASLRHHEGWGAKTLLHDRLLAATGARDMNELMHLWYTEEYPRSRIATYAPMVDQAAKDGDRVAGDILSRMARQLTLLAMAVRNRLFKEGDEVHVAPIGGVWQSELLLQHFTNFVHVVEGNRVAPPRYAPAVGALLEAYQLAGVTPHLANVPENHK